MSSGAPQSVPEGFCDLPPVPGLPDLHLDVMRDLMSGPDGAAVMDHLETRWRQRGLAEGDEAELDAQAEMHSCDLDSDQARHKSGALRAGSMVCNDRGQRFTPCAGAVNRTVSARMSALRALLLVPQPLLCPEGTGSPSGGPQPGLLREMCPSSDTWASDQAYACMEVCTLPALERGLLLLLRACTPPSRALPQPPPPPQPWPPSGVHFHPSHPPFGRSCVVPALLCALCAALVRRIERPIWLSGQLPGRQEQRW